MKAYYLTTAIDYANGSPHLGHAYEKVLADVIARHRRLLGQQVHFLTGLDEHGQKVQQASRKAGRSPQEFVDDIAVLFGGLCEQLRISNDDFIRTTEPRHQSVVRSILQNLYDKGDIYRGEYTGFYSVRQEQFVLEKDQVNGVWPEIYGEVVPLTEANYFFRLSRYQDWLIEHLKTNDFVFPRFRQKQVLEFLKEPLNDLCISRPVDRLAWGIPLPFDPQFVTYVWFDALINYISAVGYGTDRFDNYWPCDCHIIGKDILVPAHSVYWPIMLRAIGVPLPKSLLVHGWWHSSGRKLSKSTGLVVDPLRLATDYGPDAFRYFVIREMTVGQDGDFSIELFLNRYSGDLADNLGNLVSRLLNLAARHCPNGFPAPSIDGPPEKELREAWLRTSQEVPGLYHECQFHAALEKIFAFVTCINRYAEVRAPWKLAKDPSPEGQAILGTSLATMAEALRLSCAFLAPVMTGTADKIHALLGQPPITQWAGLLEWGQRLTGVPPGPKTILFPRPNPPASEGEPVSS